MYKKREEVRLFWEELQWKEGMSKREILMTVPYISDNRDYFTYEGSYYANLKIMLKCYLNSDEETDDKLYGVFELIKFLNELMDAIYKCDLSLFKELIKCDLQEKIEYLHYLFKYTVYSSDDNGYERLKGTERIDIVNTYSELRFFLINVSRVKNGKSEYKYHIN